MKNGMLEGELFRTAEMLVDIVNEQGIYFAIAFLYDSSYDIDRLKALLPILQNTSGTLTPLQGTKQGQEQGQSRDKSRDRAGTRAGTEQGQRRDTPQGVPAHVFKIF